MKNINTLSIAILFLLICFSSVVFRVADGATLTLENLTLNGRDPIDNAGTVRLRAVTLVGE